MNGPSPLPACVASLRSSLSLLESSTAIVGEGVQDFQRMGEVLAVTRVGPMDTDHYPHPPPPHPPSSPWAPSSGPPGPPSGDAVSLHTTAQTPPYTRKALLNTLCLFRQHFEVTSESQLVAAQEQVRGEIEPEVARLLDRVDGHLDRLARREDALIARTELLQGRVGDGAAAAAKAGSSALGKAWGKGKGKGNATVPTASAETPRDHRIEERLRALRQKKERLAFAVERLSLQAGQRERQLRKSMAG